MVTAFKNPFFQDHYESSISPIIARVQGASNLFEQHGSLGDLADAVETAATLFPAVGEDINALRKLQERVIEQVLSPARVEAQRADPEVMRAFKPAGIARVGNNCWANAVLQFLVNAPTIAKNILRERCETAKKLSPILKRYYEAQIEDKEVADRVDGQLLRQFSDQLSPDRSVMEDPVVALEGMLEKLEFKYDFYQEFLYADGTKRKSRTYRQEQMLQLDMMSGNRTFKDLIESFFLSQVDDGSQIRLQFKQAPEDLLIHARRFGEKVVESDRKKVKVTDDIVSVPSYFDIAQQYVDNSVEKVHYELTGAIIHKGSELDSGHYVAVVKKPGHWYLIDDHKVTELPSTAAQDLLKQGYFFHYKKAERFPEEKDFAIIDVDGTEPKNGWTVVSAVSKAVTGILFAVAAPLLNYFQWSK